jgi:hypothetical protein
VYTGKQWETLLKMWNCTPQLAHCVTLQVLQSRNTGLLLISMSCCMETSSNRMNRTTTQAGLFMLRAAGTHTSVLHHQDVPLPLCTPAFFFCGTGLSSSPQKRRVLLRNCCKFLWRGRTKRGSAIDRLLLPLHTT